MMIVTEYVDAGVVVIVVKIILMVMIISALIMTALVMMMMMMALQIVIDFVDGGNYSGGCNEDTASDYIFYGVTITVLMW